MSSSPQHPAWQPDKSKKWDQRFLELAQVISTWSKDPSTKVGAVVVGPNRELRATGYNGIPRGVKDPPDPTPENFNPYPDGFSSVGDAFSMWHERVIDKPSKYLWTEHAERNALYDAARRGTSLEGCTLYVWPLPPCADCARGIIQVGIERVVYAQPFDAERAERWKDQLRVAGTLLYEAKVQLEKI